MKFLFDILRRWHLSYLLLVTFHSSLFSQGSSVSTYFLNDPVTNTQLVAFENSRALLIGIDNYKQVEPRLSSIKSVNTFAAFLNKNHGFPLSNISVLTNENATKQNIISALNKLSQTG
ncbi:MAG: caspase family protein, partial [Ignavibacteria bacterium]|nr:caspase family protein [Ignavibacteria bacterium]